LAFSSDKILEVFNILASLDKEAAQFYLVASFSESIPISINR